MMNRVSSITGCRVAGTNRLLTSVHFMPNIFVWQMYFTVGDTGKLVIYSG
jgi:hypothetical protein